MSSLQYPDYNHWLEQTTSDTRARLLRQLGDCYDRSTASALAYTRNAIVSLQLNAAPDQWDSVRHNIEIVCQTYQQQLANIVAGISAQTTFIDEVGVGVNCNNNTANTTSSTQPSAASTSALYCQTSNGAIWNNNNNNNHNAAHLPGNEYSGGLQFLQQIGTEVAQAQVQTHQQQQQQQQQSQSNAEISTPKKKQIPRKQRTPRSEITVWVQDKSKPAPTKPAAKKPIEPIRPPNWPIPGVHGFRKKRNMNKPPAAKKPPKLSKKARAELRNAERAKAAREAAKAEREARRALNPPKPRDDTVLLLCTARKCTEQVRGRKALKEHLKEAHGIDAHQCFVKDCRNSYPTAIKLSDHVNLKHSHLEEWPCCVCERAFSSHSSLRAHYHNCHKNGEYKCSHCEKVLATMYKLHAHMQKVHKIDPISKEKLPCPWKARLAAMEKLVPDVETQKEVEILDNNQSETSQEPSAMVEALLEEEEEDDEVQIIENNHREASQVAGESIVEEENRENGQTEKWQDPIAVVFYNDAQDAPVAEESTQPQSQDDDDDDEVEILETNQSAQWLGPTALIYSNGNPQAPVAEEPPLPQAQEQPGATPVNQVVENLLELLPNDI